MDTSIHLCTNNGCFHITIAELSMHDRDYLASKPYSHCVLYREKINFDLAVNHSFPESMKVQAKINLSQKTINPGNLEKYSLQGKAIFCLRIPLNQNFPNLCNR